MHFAPALWRSAARFSLALVATSLFLATCGDLAGAPPKGRRARKRPKTAQQDLYGISWHKSVEGALQAAAADEPGKPVFWLRMLGELGGYS